MDKTKISIYENSKKRGTPFVDFLAYTIKNLNLNFDLEESVFLNCSSITENFVKAALPYLLPDPIYMYLFENNLLNYEICKNPGMGYRFRITFPGLGINISAMGVTPGHGIHVVLSGSILARLCIDREDLRQFRDSFDTKIDYIYSLWSELYPLVINDKGVLCLPEIKKEDLSFFISRIDIAYDFEVPFLEFYDRVEHGLYFSRSKVLPHKNVDVENHGTIYLGARSSPFFVRIYDKAKEIKDKMHKMLGIVYDDVPENYTRVEFEIKNHQRCNYAIEAFNLYCESSVDIGNLCWSVLKFYDYPEVDSNETFEPKILWDVYESVILYNNEEFTIEYNKSYQTSINLTYLQNCANNLVTYCKRLPGLLSWLKSNLSDSKSAIKKCTNIDVDFDVLYKAALQVENDQEKLVLEHLTFFDSDISKVD